MNWQERARGMLDLYGVREQFGRPRLTPRDKRRMINQGYMPFEQRVLTLVRTQPDLIIKQLEHYKETSRSQKKSTSRPAICASYILDGLVRGAQDYARQHLDRRRIPEFILWTDVSYGSMGVVSRIFNAELEIGKISGVDEEAIEGINLIEEWRGTPKDIGTKVEHLMGIKADSRDAAHLLMEDPSGFSLVDDIARQIREKEDKLDRPPKVLTYQVPEFVACGAELAAKAYKAIYPLSSQR